ncbi:hypothetical protein Pmar_PMAR029379, partial [Perkinsus marinus ATCC 50983]
IREKYTVATTMRTEMQSLQRILNEQHRVLHSNAAAGNESGALQSEIQGARQRQHVMTPQCLGDVLRLSSLGVSETADYG